MNRPTFFLIDDDPSIRRMLTVIIEGEDLGTVTGEAGDGESAERDVLALKPDILLLELLLPQQDGVMTMRRLKERGFAGRTIMISRVTEQILIGQAYNSGIEFFIRKPLNKTEIVAIIKSVIEKMQLHKMLEAVREALAYPAPTTPEVATSSDGSPLPPKQVDLERARKVLLRILSDLGILGEAGCRDINSIIMYLLSIYEPSESLIQLHHLQSVYKAMREYYQRSQEKGPSFDEKAIEQRVRRAVGAALHNVASLGVEDYTHQLFNTYANKLFDFSEVRNEMRFLRHESPYHGKINVKKFLEALLIEVQQQSRN
ncbi:MAG: response regulator [Symbiobacteriaceae bacterium]|nr:response regulator [Symbiobacteriaceae bacterium]